MKKIIPIFLIIIIILGIAMKASSAPGTIVCFGDSLTQGVGAKSGEDWPSILKGETDRAIINSGVGGNTTKDALARINKDVIAHKPSLVIVEFGINDSLQKFTPEQFVQNLEQIIQNIQASGAKVVLISAFSDGVGVEYLPGIEALSEKYKLPIIRNILQGIKENPALMSDWVHPNGQGYKLIADRILPYLSKK